MDDGPANAFAPHGGASVAFRPDRRFTLASAAGAAVAAVVAATYGDPAGRFLAALVAVVLLGYVVGDVVFSPRVVADASGVRVCAPLTRATLPWGQVERVRADDRIRLGLRSTTLEIDAGVVFVVLSRRTLGAEPHEAATAIESFRPR